jgi:hypothetical protein
MSERNEPTEEAMIDRVRSIYNVPGETPRAAMWDRISASIDDGQVVDIAVARTAGDTGVSGRWAGWAVAAAALLILGVGIGRMTVPAGVDVAVEPGSRQVGSASLALAAQEHLGRTESLLTMVRADARNGTVDPATAGWAKELLSETRMLMDVPSGDDAAIQDLLLDLELILIQIAWVGETGSMDEERARTELGLTLRSLEEGEFLPRIQAAMPPGMSGT